MIVGFSVGREGAAGQPVVVRVTFPPDLFPE
jgi:hypothetical protein